MLLLCDCVAQASLAETPVSSLAVACRLSRCGTWA